MRHTDDVVEAVHEHWILSGVDPDQADEMADELADHLRSALAEGKVIEAVVGADLRQFADEWAAPVVDPWTKEQKLKVVAIGAAMFLISLTASSAVFDGTGPVTIDPAFVFPGAILGGMLGYLLVSPAGSRVTRRGVRSKPFDIVLVGAALAVFIAGWVWLFNNFESEWTLPVPGWVVIPAGIVTFTVLVFPLVAHMKTVERSNGVVARVARFFFDLL